MDLLLKWPRAVHPSILRPCGKTGYILPYWSGCQNNGKLTRNFSNRMKNLTMEKTRHSSPPPFSSLFLQPWKKMVQVLFCSNLFAQDQCISFAIKSSHPDIPQIEWNVWKLSVSIPLSLIPKHIPTVCMYLCLFSRCWIDVCIVYAINILVPSTQHPTKRMSDTCDGVGCLTRHWGCSFTSNLFFKNLLFHIRSYKLGFLIQSKLLI